MIDREPLADPTEAHHDLIADHHDAVAVTQVPHPGQVAVGRNDHAVGADDRLEDDRRHRVGALHRHDRLEVLERPDALLGLVVRVERRPVRVRAEEVHDAG